MRGGLFGALCIGTGPGDHVHRDTAPIIWCICDALSTEMRHLHSGPHHHHHHHPHHHHHQAFDSNTRFLFLVCVTVMFQNPADGSCADRVLGSSRRRRERRLRSMLRHERMTVAMALAEFSHHSSRGQRMARAGVWGHEQNYTAKIRKPPTPQPELFSLEEEPGGGLPAPLSEVAGRQDKVVRHVMEDLGSVCPFVQILDLPVPQMMDQFAGILNLEEDVLDAGRLVDRPKFIIEDVPMRSSVPEPQLAEQLFQFLVVEDQVLVFKVFPLDRVQQRRLPRYAFLSGLWSRSLTLFLVEVFLVHLLLTLQLVLKNELMRLVKGFFSHFSTKNKKCDSTSALGGRNCSPSRAHPRRLLSGRRRWRSCSLSRSSSGRRRSGPAS